MSASQHPETKAIRIQTPRTPEMEHSTPLFLTSSFCFDEAEDMRAAFADENDMNIYSRFVNPTVEEFVQKICALEGAEEGFATATGMAAISSTFLALLQQGDHILSGRAVFGSTHTLFTKYLPKFGISTTYMDADRPDTWAALIQPNTKLIYLETPTNPALEIVDLSLISALAKQHGIILVVDNCFATPVLQRPIEYGADIIIHSATKWIDGQGRVLGGVIAGRKDLVREIYLFCRNTGPSLSPFNAWVLSKSLETLHVRMERHCANALFLANELQQHPAIEWLKYPHLPSHPQYDIAIKQMSLGGGILCFGLKGGLEKGRQFLDALQMLSVTANLGDTRSIASHPSSTTHSKLSEAERMAVGISPGLIRISAGLEHREDILKDILQALDNR
jgi:O-succinylhomoserine sulfhydrylase